MANVLLDAALSYATDRGWYVFPCAPEGKRPTTPTGLHAASTDPAVIRDWWTRWPKANVAVNCGRSGLVVIDVDPRHGGLETLAALPYDFPPTLSQVTGSGGAHYVYRMPDPPVKNTVNGLPGIEGETNGIDVRGLGGYIVVTPSRTTGRYEWLTNWNQTVEPAPSWLKQTEPLRRDAEPLVDVEATPPGYGRKALDGETTRVATAIEGTRNHTLNTAAFNCGQLVAVEVLDEADVIYTLTGAALAAGLDEREIAVTLNSGLEAGKTNPRRVAV